MRLLDTAKIQVVEVHSPSAQPYAILSHTWEEAEVFLQDLDNLDLSGRHWDEISTLSPTSPSSPKCKAGFAKLQKSTEVARRDGFQYIWVDTCCIDKSSSAELSEAINSMYRWYQQAEVCYAFLSDVAPAGTEDMAAPKSSFRRSRWFTRGWTLQELIAARQVEFFAGDWSPLGNKTQSREFTGLISDITGVQVDVLTTLVSPADISVASRMSWAAERQTTRVEDIAYCLLGIFDVNIPLLYGEGKKAFIRLQEAILIMDDQDHSLFAWHTKRQSGAVPGASDSRLSGLLADSPDQFWDMGDLDSAMPLSFNGNPSAVTSKGLCVDLFLTPIGAVTGADFRVILSCERIRNGRRESPAIYLKRLWGVGDQYARVFTDMIDFASPNVVSLEGGFHQSIYVKQQPGVDLRLIRIMSSQYTNQLLLPLDVHATPIHQWRIKDAWPRQGWNDKMNHFETLNLTFGMPAGVLRIEAKSLPPYPRVIDIAVGMQVIGSRSSRSWCQVVQSGNPVLDLESAFRLVMQEATLGNLPYKALSTHDIDMKPVPTWAIVSEVYRKRGLDILLDLTTDGVGFSASDLEKDVFENNFLSAPQVVSEEELIARGIRLERRRLPQDMQEHFRTMAFLTGNITIVDSIEVSIFPKNELGHRVRTGPPDLSVRRKGSSGTPITLLRQFCESRIESCPLHTRRAVQAANRGTTEDVSNYILREFPKGDGPCDPMLELRPVHWAVIGENTKALELLLENGANPCDTGGAQITALHLAMLQDNWEKLHSLLKLMGLTRVKRDFELPFTLGPPIANTGDSIFHFAAAYVTDSHFWQTEVCEFLVHAAEVSNVLGEKPLHRAAAMGNIAAMKYLVPLVFRSITDVSCDSVWSEEPDNRGRSTLWHAACGNSAEAVKILLAAGANPDFPDDDGLTPVHVACREGHERSLRALLDDPRAHASIWGGAVCYTGGNARDGAPSDSYSGVGPYLPLLPAHLAAMFGHTACLELLLARGAAISTSAEIYWDEKDGDGRLVTRSGDVTLSALHLAITFGHEDCARAIWSHQQPEFAGWTLCLTPNTQGQPEVRWLFVQTNSTNWIAMDEGDQVEDFTIASSATDGRLPRLWSKLQHANKE